MPKRDRPPVAVEQIVVAALFAMVVYVVLSALIALPCGSSAAVCTMGAH